MLISSHYNFEMIKSLPLSILPDLVKTAENKDTESRRWQRWLVRNIVLGFQGVAAENYDPKAVQPKIERGTDDDIAKIRDKYNLHNKEAG